MISILQINIESILLLFFSLICVFQYLIKFIVCIDEIDRKYYAKHYYKQILREYYENNQN